MDLWVRSRKRFQLQFFLSFGCWVFCAGYMGWIVFEVPNQTLLMTLTPALGVCVSGACCWAVIRFVRQQGILRQQAAGALSNQKTLYDLSVDLVSKIESDALPLGVVAGGVRLFQNQDVQLFYLSPFQAGVIAQAHAGNPLVEGATGALESKEALWRCFDSLETVFRLPVASLAGQVPLTAHGAAMNEILGAVLRTEDGTIGVLFAGCGAPALSFEGTKEQLLFQYASLVSMMLDRWLLLASARVSMMELKRSELAQRKQQID